MGKAEAVDHEQGESGYYFLRHRSGKCLHPEGWSWWKSDQGLMVLHTDCDPLRHKHAQWFNVCNRNRDQWISIWHRQKGRCMRAESPYSKKLLYSKEGCRDDNSSQWIGIEFGHDRPC